TPTISTSAFETASSRSLVVPRLSGKVNPGRYDGFSCFSLTAAATSGLRAHSTVGLRPALSDATVVPQDPAPSTVTRIGDSLSGRHARTPGSIGGGWAGSATRRRWRR